MGASFPSEPRSRQVPKIQRLGALMNRPYGERMAVVSCARRSSPSPHMHRDRNETYDATLLAIRTRVAPSSCCASGTLAKSASTACWVAHKMEIREPQAGGK